MAITTRFRFLGVFAVLAVILGVVWYMQDETSAQKNSKNLATLPSEPVVESKLSDNFDSILLNSGNIAVNSETAQAERQAVGAFAGKRLHLVRFNGPIQGKWVDSLERAGVEIVNYIPHYAYLVYGDATALQKIQEDSRNAASGIEWDGAYRDEYKIQPGVYASEKIDGRTGLKTPEFEIQLIKDDSTNAETFAVADKFQKASIKGRQQVLRYVNFVTGLDEEGLKAMSARPDVISIHPHIVPTKFDEKQNFVLRGNFTGAAPGPDNWLTYLANRGFTQAQFTASNFAVDLSDSGVDTATPANPNQFVLRLNGDPSGVSRFIYSRLEGTANSGSTLQGCDGHGNINASIIAGMVPNGAPFNAFPHADADGFRYGMGVAPFVRVGSSVIFDPDFFTSPNIPNLQSRAYQDGARISSNSWGAATGGAYNANGQTYDAMVRDAQSATSVNPTAGNQEMVILFAAGNQGAGANTVGSPGVAKNVITVGASENPRAFGGADGCGSTDASADHAMDIVGFSSRGPNDDGRVKPDLMLPGSHVSGTAAQSTNASPVTGNGSQLACFDASGVCGGPAPNFDFFPLGQQWYTASSGTSHSTPAVAGYAALIRQHFINQSLTPPSPAMTKAIMMNSAEYMTGTSANDTLPSNNQGMGLADMDRYFSIFDDGRVLRDQVAADTFSDTGQQRVYAGNVATTSKPFRVTLAWTDAIGPTTGNAFVNNLDLEVTVGGVAYKGNVFTGANSTSGGSADIRNNVESVFVPAGVSGTFVVKVKATNIAGDGIPQNADTTDQDFALVISNGSEAPVSVLESTGVTITAENGTPANNTPDPGETVTVSLGLQNVGTTASGSVTATLAATGGIVNPSGPQNYGALAAGAPAVTRPFTFTVPPAAQCGSTITLTFNVQEGSNPPFQVTRVYALGTAGVSNQNFDGVTAPALPSGWTTAQTGGATAWVTSAASPDSAPNSAFTPDVTTTGESSLVSPVVTAGAGSQIKFRHKYNLENTFDGGVLEIKIGTGAFQDILAAGGSFVEGGYDAALVTFSSCASTPNPLAPRQAWTGNQFSAYKMTTANLPASAAGQEVQFRWRFGADCSVAATAPNGWHIDNIQLPGQFTCATIPGGGEETKVRADYDGDGKTDFSVFRPSGGYWYFLNGAGFQSFQWGVPTDQVLAGDMTGDGKTDIIVRRPVGDGSTPDFHILTTDTYTYQVASFGTPTDTILIADYDGDGSDEIAAYRASSNYWFFRDDINNIRATQFGEAGDIPLAGNFTGDERAEIAVYRPSNGNWIYASQSGNSSGTPTNVQFGISTDKPVHADYDGDGLDDIAVFRDGVFWILRSSNGQVYNHYWGFGTDTPVPGDYDGDGKYDVAVFRQGVWHIWGSQAGYISANWGLSNDVPVPAKYLP